MFKKLFLNVPPSVFLSLIVALMTKRAWHVCPSWYVWAVTVEWHWQTKQKNSEKICPSATSSTINPLWTHPAVNQGLRCERPVTNRLSHGTAILFRFQNVSYFIWLSATFKTIHVSVNWHRLRILVASAFVITTARSESQQISMMSRPCLLFCMFDLSTRLNSLDVYKRESPEGPVFIIDSVLNKLHVSLQPATSKKTLIPKNMLLSPDMQCRFSV
jgi:hypothetical protein